MFRQPSAVLKNRVVQDGIKQAWEDSWPGLTLRHEEGGFILLNPNRELKVVRWPGGVQNSISVPSHPNCKFNGNDIIATFHTHPNTGQDYLQEPSETDKRAVRDDPNLKGEFYIGEFVISKNKIYLISPDGQVGEIGDKDKILDIK
jgi:hypothetical protein